MLAEVDADGINTTELARRIQRSGLRDLRSSKTPEASLAGALARDVIFCRVAPSTFALQAVVNYERRVAGVPTPRVAPPSSDPLTLAVPSLVSTSVRAFGAPNLRRLAV